MRIVNITPNLSEDEVKRKHQDAARLFLNVYQAHEQNKRSKESRADGSGVKDPH